MSDDLTVLLQERLPDNMLAALCDVASAVAAAGCTVYLVGGTVRDILLGVPTLDLDFTVVGSAPGLAESYAKTHGGRVASRSQFGTASVHIGALTIDFASARKERYPHPGSLPVTEPGGLQDDLLRRDFTINAMAVDLSSENWGALIDISGGRQDLARRTISVLHDLSFQDDPTRMLRAARYVHRLGFQLSGRTADLVRRDAAFMRRVSGPRRWKELERTLNEAEPEGALTSAQEWGILPQLHAALKISGDVKTAFRAARDHVAPRAIPAITYLCLLTYDMTPAQRLDLARDFRLSKRYTAALENLDTVQALSPVLCQDALRPSKAVDLLSDLASEALLAASLLTPEPVARQRLKTYLTEWQHVRPALSARALMSMGIAQGQSLGELLALLRRARLDGDVRTRQDEEEFVRAYIQQKR